MEVFFGNNTEIWNVIRKQTRLIIGGKVIEYSKDFMKIKFESEDEILNIPVCALIIKRVFKEGSKYYPQVLLHECYYQYEYEHQESTNL